MANRSHKYGWKRFFTPTPRNIARLGHAILGASQTAATCAVVADVKWLAITLMVLGWLGKLITEFFAEPQQQSGPSPAEKKQPI